MLVLSIFSSVMMVIFVPCAIFAFFWFLFEGRSTFGEEPDEIILSVSSVKDLDDIITSFIKTYLASYDEKKVIVTDVINGFGGPHSIEMVINYGPLYCLKSSNKFEIRRGSRSFYLGTMSVVSIEIIENIVIITGNKFLLPCRVRKNEKFLADFSSKLKQKIST